MDPDAEPNHRATLKKLRQQRTIRRKRVMIEIAAIQNLHSAEPIFPDERSPEVMLALMTLHGDRIRDLDCKIADLLDGEDSLEKEIEEAETFDMQLAEATAAVTASTRPKSADCVRSDPAAAPTCDTPGRAESRTMAETEMTTPRVPVGRLPPESDLSPEIFSGDRLKYRQFITQFACYVNRRQISPMEKLIILRKYLRDEPKQLIGSL